MALSAGAVYNCTWDVRAACCERSVCLSFQCWDTEVPLCQSAALMPSASITRPTRSKSFYMRSFVMNQKEAPARAEKLSSLDPAPPAIAAMAKKRFEELAEVQSDLLEAIREANQNWLDRIQQEATLAS